MSQTRTDLPLGVFDDPRFAKIALENSEKYKTADPFPHIYFDDFLNPEITKAVTESFPHPDDIDWGFFKNPRRL